MDFLGVLGLWLLFGIFSMAIANSKGRSGCGWFIIGCLFGPFGLLVAVLPSATQNAIEQANLTGRSAEYRKCPFCAEPIKREAIKCKHCGSEVKPLPTMHISDGGAAPKTIVVRQKTPQEQARQKKQDRLVLIGVVWVVLALAAYGFYWERAGKKAGVPAWFPRATAYMAGDDEQTKKSKCIDRGVAHYKGLGEWPRLNSGGQAMTEVEEKCLADSQEFPRSIERLAPGAVSPSYAGDPIAQCVNRGVQFFRSIGSHPTLSDGRDANTVARERCQRTTTAFGETN